MRVLLVLCSLVLVGWAQNPNVTIVEYLTESRYSTLVSLIDQAGLTDTLKGTGPFTIFAPSNRALSNVDTSDKAKLADLLRYHVLSGIYKRADFFNERLFDTLKQNARIRINLYLSLGFHTIEGVRLTYYDHVVKNGVVHFINDVLTPPTGTVLDLVSTNPNSTSLLAAVKAAGLVTFLQDQTPITMFAPTDAAFAALGASTVQGLMANPTLLAEILKYHTIPGSLYTPAYHSIYLDTFEEADQIRLRKFLFFDYEVDGVSAEGKEESATNGVVHWIDGVLIPKSLASQVAAVGGTTAAPATASSR